MISELPELKRSIGISRFVGFNFMQKPNAIFILRGYDPRGIEEVNRNHNTYFNLTGISVWNRKAENYEPIKLRYQHDTLTQIETENPEYFHKTFDLNQIQRNEIKLEHLKLENPDRKIAEKALKSLSKEQMELLELEYTFEIELDEKLYYTILDMEDGNYIAVDKKGKIYRLNHDHDQSVKLIASEPIDFFNIYSGKKSDLEKIVYE
ncbi:hypothetical protein QRD02_07395 [Aequorivita sp. SDUM287046]|uniref:Uncharacterized protein n=1 Tax=Aequorivita aurantiaca TaxID=3053356 RepID=A0ABT8DG33_9FLAO|nr:hypothetical protein [Aequorivita aurantiaca]MDN3724203.1 hypothetical protein [Aequorivita aurantiaca]